jgi:hypothetical protein
MTAHRTIRQREASFALAEPTPDLYVERALRNAGRPFIGHFTVSALIPPVCGSDGKCIEKPARACPAGLNPSN